MKNNKNLSVNEQQQLLSVLKTRFEKNNQRHKDIAWTKVLAKLQTQPGKLWSLQQMEDTGGEPDVTGFDKKTGEYIFCDCAP